jgi:O-antigen biosynthesis protein
MAECDAAERGVLRSCLLLLRWLWSGQLGGHLRVWWRLRRAARRLRASVAFDARWYLATYPDVAAAGVDPALHYLRQGAAEGRAPLPVVDPAPPCLALTGEGYRAWVAVHDTPGVEELAAVRAAVERLAWRPVIGVVVFGGDRADKAMTVASLEAQLYPDWCLTDVPCRDVTVFVSAGTVLAVTALFRIAAVVVAAPSVDLVYTDEDRINAAGQRVQPWFKPAWDPVLLAECDVIGVAGAYRCRLLDQVGVVRVTDRVTLREVARRATNSVAADAVEHIPAVLFHLPDEATRLGAVRRSNILPVPQEEGEAFRRPLVSIIIPTRDRAALLARCVAGVLQRTDYAPIECLVVDNDSRERRTSRLLRRLAADPRVRILRHPGPFNWSTMNNAAVRQARGEIIVLLNNDTEVINPAWLREMVTLAQRPEIGIVGARLLYPDGTVQHAGITIGPAGVAAHLCRGAARDDPGHGGMLRHTRSVAAVTGACMVMRRAVFDEVGCLENEHLAVTHNDIDLCLRMRARGWRVVCTPRAELYHRDAASRGADDSDKEIARVRRERAYLVQRWGVLAEHDPTINPNLSTVNGRLVLSGGGGRAHSADSWSDRELCTQVQPRRFRVVSIGDVIARSLQHEASDIGDKGADDFETERVVGRAP